MRKPTEQQRQHREDDDQGCSTKAPSTCRHLPWMAQTSGLAVDYPNDPLRAFTRAIRMFGAVRLAS
jgi:hypothetical protein